MKLEPNSSWYEQGINDDKKKMFGLNKVKTPLQGLATLEHQTNWKSWI